VSSLSEKHQVWLEEATATKSSQSFDERDSQKKAREIYAEEIRKKREKIRLRFLTKNLPYYHTFISASTLKHDRFPVNTLFPFPQVFVASEC